MNILKIDSWRDIPENYSGIFECSNGDIGYYLNGILHRDDGPAFIYPNGNMYYYLNGERHREDGPAIIWNDGSLAYYINNNDITKEVKDWIIENNIPKVWDNSHKLIFKLTFG